MARLRRLRLVSVGHVHARFRDLTLDLRDAAGLATDSTIWLRNGGGKSSLVSLFFALVRPGLRDFLGARSDGKRRELHDYVQAADRAVIVGEWELDVRDGGGEAAPILLTGCFLEWRGGMGADGNLRRLYFSVRGAPSVPAATFEGLPLYVHDPDGQRMRLTQARFQQEWGELRDQHPELEAKTTTNQREWMDLLSRAGIDPDLYQVQVRMNQREGGADEIFRFPDHESFVDFLLELAFDPAQADLVSRNIGQFRDKLRRRVLQYLPERDLVSGLVERVAAIGQVAERRAALRAEAAVVRHALGRLREQAQRRHGEAQARVEKARAEALLCVEQAVGLEEQADAARRRGASMRRLLAEIVHRMAAQALAALQLEYARSDRTHKLWQATVPLRDWREASAKAEIYRKKLEQEESEHAPLRAELGVAARAYAAAAVYHADVHTEAAATAREGARSARAAARTRRDEANRHRIGAARDRTLLEGCQRRLELARRERGRLEKLEALLAGERGDAALARLRSTTRDEEDKLDLYEAEHLSGRATLDELERKARDLAAALARARAQLETEQALVEKAGAARRALEANEHLARELEVEAPDVERMPDSWLTTLQAREHHALDHVVRLKAERAEGERVIRHLEERGILPPGRDVEAMVHRLRQRLPGAWSGWEWLIHNRREDQRRLAARATPKAADGVIVREADLELAREILESAPAPTYPVLVTTASGFEAATGAAPGFVVGPASDALFSIGAGRLEGDTRRARRTALDEELGREEGRRKAIAALHERLRSFRETYPAGWFAQAAERVERLAQAGRDLEARRAATDAHMDELRARGAELAELASRGRVALARLVRLADEVERFVREHESQEGELVRTAERLELGVKLAEGEAEKSEEAAAEAERRADDLEGDGRAHGERASLLRRDLEGVAFLDDDEPPAPAAGRVDELRESYRRLRSMYEQRVDASYSRQAREEALAEARKARGKLDALVADGPAEAEAEVAAALDSLADGETAETRVARALAEMISLKGQLGNLTQVVERRREERERATERCQELGAPPVTAKEGEEDGVPGPEQARVEAEVADEDEKSSRALAALARTRAAVASQEARDGEHAAELHERDRSRAAAIEDRYSLLALGGADGASELADDGDVAKALDHVEGRLRALVATAEKIDEDRAQACAAIRRHCTSATFEELRAPIGKRFLDLEDAQLETHCGELSAELDLRQQTLDAEIADVDRNRELLVSEALQVAEAGLHLLESAARRSRLPERVPGLGGGQFLRVSTSAPDDPGERRGRLGDLVDEMSTAGELPGGMQFVQLAVRRLARPLRVRVLFPDGARGHEMVDIPELARFSGGEQLTCAILLYCSLAQLRARTRTGTSSPSSVLLLDNPIGRASRPRFLELQRDVARAMGVQLIYTTGVNDYEALRVLPNVIRLRNDRIDRSSGQQVVEHEVTAARVGRVES